MFAMEYDGLELDHCPHCAGTWFDAGELALLFADAADQPHPELVPEVLRGLPDARTGERARRCPKCRQRMGKVRLAAGDAVAGDAAAGGEATGRATGGDAVAGAGVVLDVCARGGLFCDAGEVAALARGLAPDPDNLPARVLAFLGGALGRGDAASETEEP